MKLGLVFRKQQSRAEPEEDSVRRRRSLQARSSNSFLLNPFTQLSFGVSYLHLIPVTESTYHSVPIGNRSFKFHSTQHLQLRRILAVDTERVQFALPDGSPKHRPTNPAIAFLSSFAERARQYCNRSVAAEALSHEHQHLSFFRRPYPVFYADSVAVHRHNVNHLLVVSSLASPISPALSSALLSNIQLTSAV